MTKLSKNVEMTGERERHYEEDPRPSMCGAAGLS